MLPATLFDNRNGGSNMGTLEEIRKGTGKKVRPSARSTGEARILKADFEFLKQCTTF